MAVEVGAAVAVIAKPVLPGIYHCKEPKTAPIALKKRTISSEILQSSDQLTPLVLLCMCRCRVLRVCLQHQHESSVYHTNTKLMLIT